MVMSAPVNIITTSVTFLHECTHYFQRLFVQIRTGVGRRRLQQVLLSLEFA